MMEAKTEKSRYADVHLLINADNESGLLKNINSLKQEASKDLLLKEAVLFAIESDKPNILRKIFSEYPNYANFSYKCSYIAHEANEWKYIPITRTSESGWYMPLTDKNSRYNLANYKTQNSCPLLYAVSLKKWNCAIAIAEIISEFEQGNAEHVIIGKNNDYSNVFAFYEATNVGNKQYELAKLLLAAGVELSNNPNFLKYATKHEDRELIRIGLLHNAPYDTDLVDNELFSSEWRAYEEGTNKAKSRIDDLEIFLQGYKSISITGMFFSAMNMDNMINKIKEILNNKKLSPEQKVEQADTIIFNFLNDSARSAIHTKNWKDFDWQTNVLGLDKIWVWGEKQYKVLNEKHKEFIAQVKAKQSLNFMNEQTKIEIPSQNEKKELAPQQFFASTAERPKTMNNTNDAAIADSIPEAYHCPISKEIMKKPMFCILDGHSYEESKIRLWLSLNPRSPITNVPMNENQTVDNVLSLNRTLLDAIEEFEVGKSKSVNEMKG